MKKDLEMSYFYSFKTFYDKFMTIISPVDIAVKIGNGIKNNFENFSNTTSFHGFYEMHNAKQKRCRLFWFIIITLAFAVTSYQVYKAMCQYVNQTSTTKIVPASMDEIVFPKVKLCFAHWLHWVDWKKAHSLNFTKPTILYGLSYFSNIYSSEIFDLPKTKKMFEKQMSANNFTRISEFYKAIARKFPLIDFTESFDKNLTYFDEIDIVHKLDTYTVLCYSTNVEVMKKSFIKFVHSSHTFAFAVQDTTYKSFSDYVTNEEYNHYVANWLACHTNFVIKPDTYWTDWRNYSLPLVLYSDPFSEDATLIEYENDRYKINFDVSAHRWKRRPCRKHAKELITNRTYAQKCEAQYHLKACKCPDLSKIVLLKEDKMDNLCPNSITFLDKNRHNSISVYQTNYETCTFGTDPIATSEYKSCLDYYLCPCEVWCYTCSATITKSNSIVHQLSSKSKTEVFFMFPLGDQTLIMIETDSQTWEDFVGNVGGLLGIWTGASVLSFIQLVYICCCNGGIVLQKKFVKKETISKWKMKKAVDEKRRISC